MEHTKVHLQTDGCHVDCYIPKPIGWGIKIEKFQSYFNINYAISKTQNI